MLTSQRSYPQSASTYYPRLPILHDRLYHCSSPENNPAQVFQITAGDFVDATITFVGNQTIPTYLNATSYSAALDSSTPQQVALTRNTSAVPPVTPSTVSLILTLQDD